MKRTNWLWSLIVLVLLLLAYYLGTRGIGEQPTPPALSNIAFSEPQPDDSQFPGKVVFVSEGTYTNIELKQDFPVTVIGNSADAVKTYTDSTKFFFEAKPSASSLGEIAPTPTAETEFETEFSTLDMLNKNADSLLVEFHLADETAKSFEDVKQDYDLSFIIDPKIAAAAKYHNYATKSNLYKATVTLKVIAISDGVTGAAKARLYRWTSGTTACILDGSITVREPGSSTIKDEQSYKRTYDLVIEGITMPVTYTVSGTWTTGFDSFSASSGIQKYCP